MNVFTGLIEELGTIEQAADEPGGRRIRVRAARTREDLVLGASIAINGACQTVVGLPAGDAFEVIAVEETLRRTTLARLRAGLPVNLERPLRVGDRLGGHWVSGHIDTTGAVLAIDDRGRDLAYRIELPEGIRGFVVEKGSIAIDGVSLTVGEVDERSFRVYIIPETRGRTLFSGYRVGDRVNLEADLLAKYVHRALGLSAGAHEAGGTRPRGWGDAARRVLEAWERGES